MIINIENALLERIQTEFKNILRTVTVHRGLWNEMALGALTERAPGLWLGFSAGNDCGVQDPAIDASWHCYTVAPYPQQNTPVDIYTLIERTVILLDGWQPLALPVQDKRHKLRLVDINLLNFDESHALAVFEIIFNGRIDFHATQETVPDHFNTARIDWNSKVADQISLRKL